MRCEEPVKIIEILRLTEQGYSQREIAKSVKCGKSTSKLGGKSALLARVPFTTRILSNTSERENMNCEL
jgi:hypothetical protein